MLPSRVGDDIRCSEAGNRKLSVYGVARYAVVCNEGLLNGAEGARIFLRSAELVSGFWSGFCAVCHVLASFGTDKLSFLVAQRACLTQSIV